LSNKSNKLFHHFCSARQSFKWIWLRDYLSQKLIPEETNRKTTFLNVVVVACATIDEGQNTVPRTV